MHVHFILWAHACILYVNLYCHDAIFHICVALCLLTSLLHVLISSCNVGVWPLCAGLYADNVILVCMCTHTRTHYLCQMLLYCTCCSLHDCVWQQWSGTLNCCIMLVHRVTCTRLSVSDTHKHITLAHRDKHAEGVCIIGTSLQWKDINFISNDCCHHPFFISTSSLPPSSCSLSLPGLHIRIYEINIHTHTYTHKHTHIQLNTYYYVHWYRKSKRTADAHANTTDIHVHTRPPSCQRAKPSACLTLPLRMFWTSAVMWFSPVMWVCVTLCLICSLVSRGDRGWRRPSDWAVTNPLTTRLTVIGHDRTEGDGVSRWSGGWVSGWRYAAVGRWKVRDVGKVKCSLVIELRT